ncbi:citrate synthase-lysine N-methyltransferase CSKMT, mitochondrial [Salarias fasciatus]|uniref:Citrate synthase-lysine N-methyltransferase CSKMT, mitochondrial n=1 Tax=Salarias fasciatus TaxID=181472 RepID=A0A672GPE7_SALFA|nr:citrate synthase-lysine N-methyltransferase CSKMT, mitochondrial [Salarias fasciatus]
MSALTKSLTSSGWRILAACARQYSSLTTELIENMDKKATWDRFYTETNSKAPAFRNFEWFFGFDSVQDLILPLLRTGSRPDGLLQVLDLGCGTSALGPSVYARCSLPVHVTCADISPVAVRLMREQTAARSVRPLNLSSRLDFVELDCTQLDTRFAADSVDLILDKGTTDALLRSREGGGKADLLLRQCLKALRRSGSLLQFSDEDPDARLPWLEAAAAAACDQGLAGPRVAVQEVGELRGVCYYCYQVTAPPTA